jgi:DNA-binding GntR family transcriptional regulator
VPDLARLQGLKPGTVRHAFLALAAEGFVQIRHGRTTTIAGEPAAIVRNRLKRIQYRPELINGFLAQTGLTLEPEPP